MMKPKLKIYADFHNADRHGQLRLDCNGTIEDLARHKIELKEGLRLMFYADDLDDHGKLDELLTEGVVTYSDEEQRWVAKIDWNAIRHASDEENKSSANGN